MRSIYEFLLSKNKNKFPEDPKEGCTIDDITWWLDQLGIREHYQFDGKIHNPKIGKLLYEIGACDNHGETHWVALIGMPKNNYSQRVILNIKESSFYQDIHGNCHYISFEKAVELMLQMIADPNKVF